MAGVSRAYKRRGNMIANTGGPVLCLDAGSRLSYPGSGTAWTDLSGNGNTGTLTNGPTFSSANGGSIVFDGSNDYVSVAAISGLAAVQTISFWLKPTAFSVGMNQYILDEGSNNNQIQLYDSDSDSFPSVAFNSTLPAGNTELPVVGVWYHIMCVSAGSTLSVYINGGLSWSTGSGGSAPSNINIGRHGGGGFHFNGLISSVSIYTRALSAAEISTNFNLLRGRYGI